MTRFRGLFYKRGGWYGKEKEVDSIWGKSQIESFKKKGLNIRTSTNTTANSLSGVFPLFWYKKKKGLVL